MEQYQPPAERDEIVIGETRIGIGSGRITRGDQEVQLSGRALELFLCLASNRDKRLTKRELAEKVWARPHVEDNAIAQHIRTIRAAFGSKDVIRTFPGVGYQLNSHFFEPPQKAEVPISIPHVASRRPHRLGWSSLFAIVSAIAVTLVILIRVLHPRARHLARAERITASRRAKQAPFLSDGSWGYFTETEAGRYFVIRKRLDDTAETVLPLGVPNPYACGLSPDKRHLLLRSVPGEFDQLGPLYIADTTNWSTRRLGRVAGFDGAWSPSGGTLAISSEHDLLLVNDNAAIMRTLARVSGSIWWPRWSPDGARIRFTENVPRSQIRKLWELQVKKGTLRQVFADDRQITNPCCGSWTPEGSLYVFQTKLGDDTQLWVASEDRWPKLASGKTALLIKGFRSPSLSPTGQEIFARGITARVEAVLLDLTSGNYSVVLPDESGAFDFAPDQKFLAISTIPGSELILKQLETGEEKRIVASPAQAVSPKWSPDGRRVAFSRRLPGQPWRICLTDWKTGRAEEVYPQGPNQIDPDWSPDGNLIAFGGIPTIPDPDANARQIRVYDTRNHRLDTLKYGAGAYEPTFSPSGTEVAAVEADTQNLLIYNFISRTWRNVLNQRVVYPIWSRDGRWIYCALTSPKSSSLIRIARDTLRVEPILDIAKIGTPSSYGRWFSLLPDGSLMALRDHSVNDFYMFRWSDSGK